MNCFWVLGVQNHEVNKIEDWPHRNLHSRGEDKYVHKCHKHWTEFEDVQGKHRVHGGNTRGRAEFRLEYHEEKRREFKLNLNK